MPTTMLKIEDLHKSFGDLHVLRGINLEVQKGEVVVIIGPSGSGKSTLLRCVNRLVEPDQGHVWIEEDEITSPKANVPKLRARVGMVFQHFNLFPHMTALENVMEGPITVRKMSPTQARERAQAELRKVGLAEKAEAHPGQLSGGQKQRVAIARALAMDPHIMLFDEPTSALDPELIAEVLDVMRDLARAGMTMLVVTHEVHFAERVAHRVVMMDEGVVVEDSSPEVIFTAAEMERTQRFLRQMSWEDEG